MRDLHDLHPSARFFVDLTAADGVDPIKGVNNLFVVSDDDDCNAKFLRQLTENFDHDRYARTVEHGEYLQRNHTRAQSLGTSANINSSATSLVALRKKSGMRPETRSRRTHGASHSKFLRIFRDRSLLKMNRLITERNRRQPGI